MLDLFNIRDDFVDSELFRRLSNEPVLFAEIFRSENFLGLPGL